MLKLQPANITGFPVYTFFRGYNPGRIGMVRWSIGLYNKPEYVDALINALQEIVFRKKEFVALYHVDENGNYVHNTFHMEIENHYSVSEFVSKYLNN